MVTKRIRAWAATGVTVVMAGALVLGGAASASAAGPGTVGWADFAVDGTARAYTGTMTLPGDFPQATFTSTSRQATIPSGSSTWQGTGTPVGAEYDSSRGRPYLNLRPTQDSPTAAAASATTYTFDRATPTSDWSFVLGDVDADQVTVSATDAAGAAVPVGALGFQSTYNYCRTAAGGPSPSCDAAGSRDVPTWNATTGVLTGNAAAADTEGAAAWFSPSVPLSTLTFTYQQRSGFPVYQTWFVTKTFTASGVATSDGEAYAGATVTLVDTVTGQSRTTTTDATGAYAFPGLVSGRDYSVDVATPGAAADVPAQAVTVDGDDVVRDVAFTGATAPVAVTLPVTLVQAAADGTTAPVPDRELSIAAEGDAFPSQTITTDEAGQATFTGLDPAKDYVVTDVTTGGSTNALTPGEPVTITLPAEPVTVEVTTSIVEPDGSAPATGSTVDVVPVGETTPVASVETGAGGSFTAGGLTPGEQYEVVLDEDVDSAVTITAPATSGTIPPVQIAAPAAVTVEGTVLNADGTPAAALQLQVIEADAAEPEPVATPTTDAAGVYRAEALVPGTDYGVVLDGEVVGTFTAPFADGTVPTITLAAPPVVTPVPDPEPSPDPTVPPAPVVPAADGPGTGGSATGGSGRPLAYTGSQPGLPLGLGAAALALGLALVTGSAVVRRRARRR
ncbi:carboxypeptidase-like regulatory domain-containing protein [Frigoribacterium sp. PhB24]|uniref:carboxypeptidase-like regulatory domain-containing protein n=1 Tax=Frigoribacterium sp. PhB24 TaxID=2485204 RepID=UPI000F4AF0F5|nr:carboxypeptidase-like regulatory domain-containing protein [Frigoribacterium sp. PhB24]ROS52759.1 carboxypeptidase family protein [Frigoribacterium sp. PhB24]